MTRRRELGPAAALSNGGLTWSLGIGPETRPGVERRGVSTSAMCDIDPLLLELPLLKTLLARRMNLVNPACFSVCGPVSPDAGVLMSVEIGRDW